MTSSFFAHFQMLGRYNRIVNERLYAACADLTAEEYRKERAGSFGSINRTLNHILLGDRIWMSRFESEETLFTPALDTELFADFDELRAAREVEDARIETFVSSLTEEGLSRTIDYVNNAGFTCNDPVTLILAHLFNHQTHHRGQVHTMLSGAGVKPPSFDMHRVIRPV